MITAQDIEAMKRSIVPEKQLISDGKVLPIPEFQRTNTNCYAYSLGITCPAKGNEWYQPGFTENLTFRSDSVKDFLNKVEKDLENLGFIYRKLEMSDSKKTARGEYLIQVLFASSTRVYEGDFHFLRRSVKGRQWFHKQGWGFEPELFFVSKDTKKVYDKKLRLAMENARVAAFGFEDEEGNEIKPICFYALSRKK